MYWQTAIATTLDCADRVGWARALCSGGFTMNVCIGVVTTVMLSQLAVLAFPLLVLTTMGFIIGELNDLGIGTVKAQAAQPAAVEDSTRSPPFIVMLFNRTA